MFRRWAIAALVGVAFVGVSAALFLKLRSEDVPPIDGPTSGELPAFEGLSESTIEKSIDPEEAAPIIVDEPELAYAWQQRVIGGGGWVKGIEIHPSGEPVIARTDVGGAYRLDRSTNTWRQLIVEGRVPDLRVRDYPVDSIGLSPSDPDRIYLLVDESNDVDVGGRLLVSRDGGENWTSSDQPLVSHGNGRSRNGGERLAVSPVDADDVWLGGSDGLHRSRDAGETFEPVTSAPRGDADLLEQRGFEWMVADEAAVYIGVSGAGVYRSVDDGSSWEQLWQATMRPFDAEVDDNGVLWAVNSDEAIVRSFDPVTGEVDVIDDLSGQDLRGVAVRPDGDEIVVAVPNGLWRSTGGGNSWDREAIDFTCPSIAWQEAYDFSLFTASSPEFDPLEPWTIWIPEGFGVWSAAGINADSIELQCRVAGVEEIVVNDLLAPAADVVVAASWDRPLAYLPPGGAATAQIGPSDRFSGAWSLATMESQPNVIAAVVGDHRFCCEDDGEAYQSGRSFDGGQTWQPFGSYDNGNHPDDLRFGNIAISADDPDNLVWLPTFNAPVHYTVDGGQSWVPVILAGTEDRLRGDGANAGGLHFDYFLRRQVLIADPVAASTFYLFHQDLGLHRSTDGGVTWEIISADGLPTGWTAGWFNAELSAVPGSEGHLVYTPGQLVELVFPMFESRDGGVTWNAVAGTSAVDAVGFGAPLDGSQNPTVYISGSVNNVVGIYRSADLMDSWELVSTTAGGIGATVSAITGDPGIPGRVYVGFTGVSIMQGDAG